MAKQGSGDPGKGDTWNVSRRFLPRRGLLCFKMTNQANSKQPINYSIAKFKVNVLVLLKI